MVSKTLFRSTPTIPSVTTVNAAGGGAYQSTSKHALAQFASTGTFSDTFYIDAETQLNTVLDLASKTDSEFIAKLAVYSRHQAYMKDMPALLLAILTARREHTLLDRAFPIVISGGRMLRTYIQIVRSGKTGTKSFGSHAKKLINKWLNSRDPNKLFVDSIGNTPSLKDIIKMTHPKPQTPEQEALYGYILGNAEIVHSKLPSVVRQFELFKADPSKVEFLPDVPINMISSFPLTRKQWSEKALQLPWQALRMNLNTFNRHGVFTQDAEGRKMIANIAEKLSNVEAIRAAKVFPYQLFQSYRNMEADMPRPIIDAIHDAMETSTNFVPKINGRVLIGVDTSGSMGSPAITSMGRNRTTGSSTPITCVEIAALFAATMARVNKDVEVLGFDTSTRLIKIEPRDTIITNAKKIATPGGGTDVGAPLARWNREGAHADLVVIISDSESWFNDNSGGYFRVTRSTNAQTEWAAFRRRNKKAKIVCINITPSTSTQISQDRNVLNIGGFNDNIFTTIAGFLEQGDSEDYWVKKIEQVSL